MKFKLRSTNFESICREFARKMYQKLAFAEKEFHFSHRGILKHSFAADPALYELFLEVALPALQRKSKNRLDRDAFDSLCDKHNVARGKGLADTAVDIIDNWLSELHMTYLEGIVARFTRGKLLQAPEMTMAALYLQTLPKVSPSPQKPVWEINSGNNKQIQRERSCKRQTRINV